MSRPCASTGSARPAPATPRCLLQAGPACCGLLRGCADRLTKGGAIR